MLGKMDKVSICMITYNHGKFIAQAIESVLMQKTNFDYEIVIGEDCSTDNTREIVVSYAKKYPNKVKSILNEKNIGPIPNFVKTLNMCRGKYIAMLEGDDYWTDPYKLQKQVNFLEGNPEYGLVHTDYDALYQESGHVINCINKKKYTNLKGTDYPAERILTGTYAIHTLTVLFRKKLLDSISMQNYNKSLMGDLPLWLELSQLTKFVYIEDSTAAHRITQGSASNPKNKKDQLSFQLDAKRIRFEFAKKINANIEVLSITKRNYYRTLLIKASNENNYSLAKRAFNNLESKFITDYLLLIGTYNLFFNKTLSFVKKIRRILYFKCSPYINEKFNGIE